MPSIRTFGSTVAPRAFGWAGMLVVLTLAIPAAWADKIWRYTDAQGQPVFSNQPPSNAKRATVIETPRYPPPARWTGPTWAQAFGQDTVPSEATLVAPTSNVTARAPLPWTLSAPPGSVAQPLPPLPGTVLPPQALPVLDSSPALFHVDPSPETVPMKARSSLGATVQPSASSVAGEKAATFSSSHPVPASSVHHLEPAS